MKLPVTRRQRRAGETRRTGPAGRAARASRGGLAVVAGLTACATLVSLPAPALASGIPGTGPFGLVPSALPGGLQRSYFQFSVAPGRSVRDTAVISNESRRPERLRVRMSLGVTATNSGSAYQGITGRCRGPACWLSGLPRTVTLAAHQRRALSFRVAVPRGTRPGQYLAGITAQSALRPRSVKVGQRGRASARAIITDQVTVGVAVTVGSLARLRTAAAVTGVTAAWIGTTPRISIGVRNTGQTFARATGTLACRQHGRRHSYPVIMQTVLPGGRAVLAVNAHGLRAGSLPCTVRMHGAGLTMSWHGIVKLAGRKATRTYHVAKGVYVSLPENTVPPWAIALMVIGGLILASLAVLMLRRRAPAWPVRR